ncbi:fatty acid desaturase [Aureispira anguillae]|uniref:Fatty acid desaturase n=1 Tax=Aureispira anguillae TaxID=2864201 RepID=A0A915YHQ6_9BACT|nr:fatty acid desaturase [Aureispira anguillae]BDS13143.1 fatty acid desaturase [Aureispira anguillae]
MDTNFYKSPQLTHEQLSTLTKKRNNPALFRFIILYSLFLAASVGVILSWGGSWLAILISQSFFGMLICSLFACQHETVHNTAFKSIQWNKIAAFLTGMGYLYAPTMLRELHFTHHRHTHEPGLDPEISLGGKAIPSIVSNLPFYLSWLSGLPLFMFKLGMLTLGALGLPEPIRKNVYPFVQPEARKAIAIESLVILSVHILLVVLAVYYAPNIWGFYVGQLVGHCFLASYTAPEHNGLPHEGNILDKTRSIPSSRFVKLLMWNMPYHAEHHAYPSVPFHALPQLHEALGDELKHKDKNHPDFHWMIFKQTTIGSKD